MCGGTVRTRPRPRSGPQGPRAPGPCLPHCGLQARSATYSIRRTEAWDACRPRSLSGRDRAVIRSEGGGARSFSRGAGGGNGLPAGRSPRATAEAFQNTPEARRGCCGPAQRPPARAGCECGAAKAYRSRGEAVGRLLWPSLAAVRWPSASLLHRPRTMLGQWRVDDGASLGASTGAVSESRAAQIAYKACQ